MDLTVIGKNSSLADAIRIPRGITALVGGGGKTTTMLRLARELAGRGRVIVGTTTHIWPPKDDLPVLENPGEREIIRALEKDPAVCVGITEIPTGKLTACSVPPGILCRMADFVLLEADGAKGRPLKAPGAEEPVIPGETAMTLALAGLEGIGRTIREAAFRAERYAAVLETDLEHVIAPGDAARVLVSREGQYKSVTAGMDFVIILNKADGPVQLLAAEEVARSVPTGIAKMVLATTNLP